MSSEFYFTPTSKSFHGSGNNAYYVFHKSVDLGLVRNTPDGWIAAYQWIYFSKEKFTKREDAAKWLLIKHEEMTTPEGETVSS